MTKKFVKILISELLIVAVLTMCPISPATLSASSLKKDEEVILFPTTACADADDKMWRLPIHGWIFEREEDSIWRTMAVNKLLEILELDSNVVNQELFRQRAWLFLVDNERGKKLRIRIGDQLFAMNRSEANGHFKGLCRLEKIYLKKKPPSAWVSCAIVMPEGDQRRFEGRVQLLASEGISVISDIDDTIKVSNVLDKHELLANTFLRKFIAVEGMATLYHRWANAGAAFHYVSSSPWQLYPSLAEFIDEQGYPAGSFHLNFFRMKDKTFFNLFKSPERSKPPRIESILKSYPNRRFIFVGDSAEKDPEVYADIARRYPNQVCHLFIRNVLQNREQTARFHRVFKDLPQNQWTVFRSAAELIEFNLFDRHRVPAVSSFAKNPDPFCFVPPF